MKYRVIERFGNAVADFLSRRLCAIRGHQFVEFDDGFKRRCSCCQREEWVVGNPYPKIGQPKYEWRHMDWNKP